LTNRNLKVLYTITSIDQGIPHIDELSNLAIALAFAF
jgi:hypothetical protein